MRRNLSDTDVGILDLRRFYYKINETEVYVYFSFDYLIALGFPYSIDESDNASVTNFLKHRFNQIIIWNNMGKEERWCIKTASEGETAYIAYDDQFQVVVYEVDDGEVGLLVSEI